MVEPLAMSANAFMQDLAPWISARGGCPGARRIDALRVVAVRHFKGSQAAQAAFREAGLVWPVGTLDLESTPGLLVARRNPEEVIVVGDGRTSIDHLLTALTPGRATEAMAIELTHGLGVIELHGPRLDDWLARLVDRCSIPVEGRASRGRLVDVPVLLLRPLADTILMVADRSLFPYLAHWLAFAHDGAFADS